MIGAAGDEDNWEGVRQGEMMMREKARQVFFWHGIGVLLFFFGATRAGGGLFW